MSNDSVLGDSDEDPGHSEYYAQQEDVQFVPMAYYSDRIYGDFDLERFQRQEVSDPEAMDDDDLMEDMKLYMKREYEPGDHQSPFAPDAADHADAREDMVLFTPREQADGFQREYFEPHGMDYEDEVQEDGLRHLIDEEEDCRRHHIHPNKALNAGLATGNFHYAAMVHERYDEELSYVEEERTSSIRDLRSSGEYFDADGVLEDASLHPGDAPDYEVYGEDCTYNAEEGIQDDLHNQVRPSVSDAYVEMPDSHYSGDIGHFHDHWEDCVYTPEYKYDHDHAKEAGAKGTAAYAFVERWDQVPRHYRHGHDAHWDGSMGAEQRLMTTQPFSSDTPKYGIVHGHLIRTVYREDDENSFL